MKNLFLVPMLCFGVHASAETLAETVARFEAMGMPSVAGAEYVYIPPMGADDYRLPVVTGFGVAGNAWKLAEGVTEGRRIGTFVINGGETLSLRWLASKRQWGGVTEGELPTAEWETARLGRGVAQTMLLLDKYNDAYVQLKGEEGGISWRNSWRLERLWRNAIKELPSDDCFRSDRASEGRLFLFALQLHQHGETEEAEALAKRLAEVFGAEAVEESARIALAEALYGTAYWKFNASRDWKQFYEEVQKIVRDAPPSWGWLPGLREMLESLQYLARGERTPLPGGYAFSDEEKALIERLEFHPGLGLGYQPGRDKEILWLIPETWMGKVKFASDAECDIRALGMKAIPMLIALCDGFPDYEREGEHPPFRHPEFRSDKASRILGDILPCILMRERSYRNDQRDTRSTRALAAAFYEKYKDSSPEGLALQYMIAEYVGLNENAIAYFRKGALARRIPEFETFARTVEFDTQHYGRDTLVYALTTNVLFYAKRHNDKQLLLDFADRLDAFADYCSDKHSFDGWYNRLYSEESTQKIKADLRALAKTLREAE